MGGLDFSGRLAVENLPDGLTRHIGKYQGWGWKNYYGSNCQK
jgi:hypothetical protein